MTALLQRSDFSEHAGVFKSATTEYSADPHSHSATVLQAMSLIDDSLEDLFLKNIRGLFSDAGLIQESFGRRNRRTTGNHVIDLQSGVLGVGDFRAVEILTRFNGAARQSKVPLGFSHGPMLRWSPYRLRDYLAYEFFRVIFDGETWVSPQYAGDSISALLPPQCEQALIDGGDLVFEEGRSLSDFKFQVWIPPAQEVLRGYRGNLPRGVMIYLCSGFRTEDTGLLKALGSEQAVFVFEESGEMVFRSLEGKQGALDSILRSYCALISGNEGFPSEVVVDPTSRVTDTLLAEMAGIPDAGAIPETVSDQVAQMRHASGGIGEGGVVAESRDTSGGETVPSDLSPKEIKILDDVAAARTQPAVPAVSPHSPTAPYVTPPPGQRTHTIPRVAPPGKKK